MLREASDRPLRWRGSQEADAEFLHHHVLLVGISDYAREELVRRLFSKIYKAHADAESLHDLFYRVGYARCQVECLCNEKATYNAIEDRLERLRTMERADLVVIFWAGHGAGQNGRNLLLPYDVDPDHLDASTFTVNEVVDRASRFNAANIILLLDTCHSAPNLNGFFHPDWSAVPKRLADRVLLFAGASTYLALEDAGGGILAACLEEALTDTPGNLGDGQGLVHTHAVAAYLQWHVQQRAQEAWTRSGRPHRSPQEPLVAARSERRPAMGRNLRVHIENRLKQETFPAPMKEMARRVVAASWPQEEPP